VRARFEHLPPDAATVPGAPFDLVWCPPLTYEQIPGRERRVAWLRLVARMLRPGGVVVMLSGWKRDRGPRRAVVDGLRWAVRRVVGRRFTTEPGDRLITQLSLASDRTRPCFFHAFQSPDEIRREIEAAGLVARLDPVGAWLVTLPRA